MTLLQRRLGSSTLWFCLLAYSVIFILLQRLVFPRLHLPADAATLASACLASFPVLLYGRIQSPWSSRSAAERPGATALLYLFGLDMTFKLVVSLSTPGLDNLLRFAGLSAQPAAAPESAFSPILAIYVCLLGPVLEELIYRGVLLSRLRPYGALFALILSSICFGLMHHDLYQGLSACLSGLIYGYAALRYSLPAAICLHIAGNTVSTALPLLKEAGTAGSLILLCLVFGSFLVALLGTLLLVSRKKKQPRWLSTQSSPLRPANMLSSPMLWVVILFDTAYTLKASLTLL